MHLHICALVVGLGCIHIFEALAKAHMAGEAGLGHVNASSLADDVNAPSALADVEFVVRVVHVVVCLFVVVDIANIQLSFAYTSVNAKKVRIKKGPVGPVLEWGLA